MLYNISRLDILEEFYMGYKQAQQRKKRLYRTYCQTRHSCGGGVWFDEESGRYRKYTVSNTPGYTKTLRRQSNKKVRRLKDLDSHGAYKKAYDYWWILY
jgi:hypothetical protein